MRGLWIYFYEFCVDNYQVINVCTKLHHLNLIPQSTDSEYSQVFCLINTECLEIDCENSTENTLSDIFKLKGLKRLNLHDVQSVSKEFLRELGTISTVQYLELTGCELNASMIRGLTSLRKLKGLSLSPPESSRIDSECLDMICGSFVNLEELRLVDNSYLTDADGVKLRRLKNLRKLELLVADKLTDLTFEGGLGSPSLTELLLVHCPLTNAGLAGIASNHKMLKIISLEYCHNITDDGVIFLLERETLLQEFFVNDCRSLDGRWIEELEDLCPRLRTLYACDHDDLSQFRAKRPEVRG